MTTRLNQVGVALLVLTAVWLRGSEGHGSLLEPPGRNVAQLLQSRVNGTEGVPKCPAQEKNYNYNANFCGGRGNQRNNGGKCSACGENYAHPYPRPHDFGGKFAKKIIPVRAYLQGQQMPVKVKITAQHKGFFEFRLCLKKESDEVEQGHMDALSECFEDPSQYIVLRTVENELKYPGIDQSIDYELMLKLPADVTCPYGCAFQWRYQAANNPPNMFQEHFVNCADIIIASCEDYTSGNIGEYCFLGPTDELSQCDGGTGSPPGTGAGSGSGNSGGGSQGNTGNSDGGSQSQATPGGGQQQQSGSGTVDNTDTGSWLDNGDSSWDESDNSDNYGDNYGTDNYGTSGGNGQDYGQNSGNAGKPDIPTDGQQPPKPPAQPQVPCPECKGLNCDNECCEMKSVQGIAPSFFDGYCKSVCFHTPPFCPASHCKVNWVMKPGCGQQEVKEDLKLTPELLEMLYYLLQQRNVKRDKEIKPIN